MLPIKIYFSVSSLSYWTAYTIPTFQHYQKAVSAASISTCLRQNFPNVSYIYYARFLSHTAATSKHGANQWIAKF